VHTTAKRKKVEIGKWKKEEGEIIGMIHIKSAYDQA
jgi:hypothetical protein